MSSKSFDQNKSDHDTSSLLMDIEKNRSMLLLQPTTTTVVPQQQQQQQQDNNDNDNNKKNCQTKFSNIQDQLESNNNDTNTASRNINAATATATAAAATGLRSEMQRISMSADLRHQNNMILAMTQSDSEKSILSSSMHEEKIRKLSLKQQISGASFQEYYDFDDKYTTLNDDNDPDLGIFLKKQSFHSATSNDTMDNTTTTKRLQQGDSLARMPQPPRTFSSSRTTRLSTATFPGAVAVPPLQDINLHVHPSMRSHVSLLSDIDQPSSPTTTHHTPPTLLHDNDQEQSSVVLVQAELATGISGEVEKLRQRVKELETQRPAEIQRLQFRIRELEEQQDDIVVATSTLSLNDEITSQDDDNYEKEKASIFAKAKALARKRRRLRQLSLNWLIGVIVCLLSIILIILIVFFLIVPTRTSSSSPPSPSADSNDNDIGDFTSFMTPSPTTITPTNTPTSAPSPRTTTIESQFLLEQTKNQIQSFYSNDDDNNNNSTIAELLQLPLSKEYQTMNWFIENNNNMNELSLTRQRYVLVLFTFATNWYASIENSGNWLVPEEHECDWNRDVDLSVIIRCHSDTTKELNHLAISAQYMDGSIPTEIGWLTSLTHLSIEFNTRTDVPSTSGDSLRLLRHGQSSSTATSSSNNLRRKELENEEDTIENCKMIGMNSNLPIIPSTIGQLTKLNDLSFEWALLQGPIPSEIGNLQALTKLNLGSNYLSDTIPSELYRLRKLHFLKLEYNCLSGPISSDLTKLSHLENLLFSKNYLTGRPPAILPNRFTKLTSLDLSFNFLTGPAKDYLGGFQTWDISLEFNKFTGNIDVFICPDQDDIDISADCLLPSPKVGCECCNECCNTTHCCIYHESNNGNQIMSCSQAHQ